MNVIYIYLIQLLLNGVYALVKATRDTCCIDDMYYMVVSYNKPLLLHSIFDFKLLKLLQFCFLFVYFSCVHYSPLRKDETDQKTYFLNNKINYIHHIFVDGYLLYSASENFMRALSTANKILTSTFFCAAESKTLSGEVSQEYLSP